MSFYMELFQGNQVYVIDFGLAKKFRDQRTHQHIPYRCFAVFYSGHPDHGPLNFPPLESIQLGKSRKSNRLEASLTQSLSENPTNDIKGKTNNSTTAKNKSKRAKNII